MPNQLTDKIATKIIEISFYALLFITPFLMNQQNSEIFELPKMFFVWLGTVIIVGVWIIRMVINERIIFHRTFLDIPLVIFLISQSLSYFFSIDQHTSFWGYYSRFNGGLLSFISYSVLYWAFVSNFTSRFTLYALRFLLISALLVALWGIPAHFGKDPSCFLFMYNSNLNFIENIKHNLNADCWTAQFVPTVRIFSTLGQPNWLAAWLVALAPLAWTIALVEWKSGRAGEWKQKIKLLLFYSFTLLLLLTLFYTRSQSGFMGLGVALIVLLIGMLIKQNVVRSAHILLLTTTVGIISTTLLFVKFPTFTNSVNTCFSIMFSKNSPVEFTDITPSWQIRCIVWKGALQIWQNHPVLGTGPETFAYSYYQFRPPEHNLTSEWDFLYNKAHNEYLNILANTGLIGLISYFLLIFSSITLFMRIITNKNSANKSEYSHKLALFKFASNSHLVIALLSGFVSILVTNFFGFSVVPLQLLFFLFPAMAMTLATKNVNQESRIKNHGDLSVKTILFIILFIILTSYFLLLAFRYYLADLHYSKAERLANQDNYLSSFSEIKKAIDIRPTEPLYQNELANILSSLILLIPSEDQETKLKIAKLAKEASDQAVSTSPQNLNFLRTRSSMFIRLGAVDEVNFDRAAQTLEEAIKLAPTEPKLAYNLGFLYLQTGQYNKAKLYLSKALELRPNYQDPKLALEKLKELNP